MIDLNDTNISIRHQCKLLGLNRSSIYYEALPESEETLNLMHPIDKINTDYPFYGSRKVVVALEKQGLHVCRERVQNLMRKMGIATIYPKANLSKRRIDHVVYPYLLRGVQDNRPQTGMELG